MEPAFVAVTFETASTICCSDKTADAVGISIVVSSSILSDSIGVVSSRLPDSSDEISSVDSVSSVFVDSSAFKDFHLILCSAAYMRA